MQSLCDCEFVSTHSFSTTRDLQSIPKDTSAVIVYNMKQAIFAHHITGMSLSCMIYSNIIAQKLRSHGRLFIVSLRQKNYHRVNFSHSLCDCDSDVVVSILLHSITWYALSLDVKMGTTWSQTSLPITPLECSTCYSIVQRLSCHQKQRVSPTKSVNSNLKYDDVWHVCSDGSKIVNFIKADPVS